MFYGLLVKVTVHGFCSLIRITKLFFENFEERAASITVEEEKCHEIEYQEKIVHMVDHINNSGGWTVFGWFKLGEVVDLAAAI